MKRYASKRDLASKSVVALTRSNLAMGSKSLVNSMIKMPKVKSKTNLSSKGSKERIPRKSRSKKGGIKHSLSKSMFDPAPSPGHQKPLGLIRDISASYLQRLPEEQSSYMNINQQQSQ